VEVEVAAAVVAEEVATPVVVVVATPVEVVTALTLAVKAILAVAQLSLVVKIHTCSALRQDAAAADHIISIKVEDHR
jgi:hypothetical protein